MANLVEGIQQECNRIREQIPDYEACGPAGAFGVAMMRADIARGEAAIASGDIVEMLTTCAYLKEQCK